jgi:hypothetical protein
MTALCGSDVSRELLPDAMKIRNSRLTPLLHKPEGA